MTIAEKYCKQKEGRKSLSDKYVVCVCAKNEDNTIREWIQYYLTLGFDTIIIADNNNTNILEGILEDYIKGGIVELYDFRGDDDFQVQLYSEVCKEGDYKWCAFFDADEYLELNCYSDIKEFLATINEDCVLFHWLMYGSNGRIFHEPEYHVTSTYTVPVFPISMFPENMLIKSIVRGGVFNDGCWFYGSHLPRSDTKTITYNVGGVRVNNRVERYQFFPICYKCGYIKHYYTKSLEEWQEKASRGWPDGTKTIPLENFNHFNNALPNPDFYMKPVWGLDVQNKDFVHDLVKKNKVIKVTTLSEPSYSFLLYMSECFKTGIGHIYAYMGSIDDTLYDMAMELAMRTGNKLIYARDEKEFDTFLWNNQISDFYNLQIF